MFLNVRDIEIGIKEDAKRGREAKKSDDKKKEAGRIRLGRLKKTTSTNNFSCGFSKSEVTELRKSIYSLFQATGPLEKCRDHVHDGIWPSFVGCACGPGLWLCEPLALRASAALV